VSTPKTSGSVTPTVGAETDLATITDPGRYFLKLDVDALAAGEAYEVNIYSKARTGDTERLMRSCGGTAPFVEKLHEFHVHGVDAHIRFTYTQINGTARAVLWQVNNA
jgi:hypothetical protein